jgi:hypothetical protein
MKLRRNIGANQAAGAKDHLGETRINEAVTKHKISEEYFLDKVCMSVFYRKENARLADYRPRSGTRTQLEESRTFLR